MFNHILVPLDGSEYSERALDSAFSVAEAYGGARVTLLAVMLRFPESKIHVPKMDEQSEGRGKEYLRALIERAGPHGFPVDLIVKLGVPAREIVATAKDMNVDLIVMSTHGTTGLERDQRSIGSTAWRVLHDAPCPVLLLPVRVPD
jgi:nucleotide-binding universal stress UspA family protein